MKTATLLAAALATLSSPVAAQTFERPGAIRWGATTEQMQAALASSCTTMNTRPINPPFLPNTRTQLQIDCDGFPFLGAGRWAEFVIGDGQLKMVWIMVRPEEQDAIVASMRSALPGPVAENAKYIAFPTADAAWRHRPAEVLFYSDAVADWAERWFRPDQP